MDHIYSQLRDRARRIASRLPHPEFYSDFRKATEQAKRLLKTHPILTRLRLFVAEHIEDDFGHGLEHAEKVTADAGALMIIEAEGAGYSDALKDRGTLLVECAGLLHDIKRKHENHAVAGAEFSAKVLQAYPFSPSEIEDISKAIRNHEAFKKAVPVKSPEGNLISDCLYDADKFRWGPDNFQDTVWDMVSFSNIPFSEFMARYPKGMKGLERIKTTFRTKTGRKYGPQFIDMGLVIGQELHEIILKEFSHLL